MKKLFTVMMVLVIGMKLGTCSANETACDVKQKITSCSI